LSSVAGSGEWPSPQVLIQNTATAVAELATCSRCPPPIVLQPSEGHTARSVLRVLALGHDPRHVPLTVARATLKVTGIAQFDPRLISFRRRLQMLWFGQRQVPGWLTSQGFSPPLRTEGWAALAAALADQS
jgi:hypothetical protein